MTIARLALYLFIAATAMSAQQRTVTLRGSRNPRIAGMADEGPVEDAARVAGLSLRFKPSDAQLAALESLLDNQQNPSSPLYHAWLTPEEFGSLFGVGELELAKVKRWLAAQGFQIGAVARSRTFLTFSGTAAQARNAFGAELRRYRAGAQTHFANAAELELPAELAEFVSSISGLDDFRSEARPRPLMNLAKGGHYVAPGDLQTIYNIRTLHLQGLTGKGQTIVIAGQSLFDQADLDLYRSKHGLPPTTPTVIAVPGHADPGIAQADDFAEAEIDIEFAGIAAPDANLVFVYCDDVWAAAQYAIDQHLGPVLSFSYDLCERWALPSEIRAIRFLARQANAQGITWVAASGDSGVAGCDVHAAAPTAVYGVSVNLPASLPEVTGVGGTEFDEGTANFWSDSNDADGGSAISYIPETGWNDSSPKVGLAASGGGVSVLWGKPAWQTGVGVPDAKARHVPDIAFTASWKHDAYAIIHKGDLKNAGGTSAGAPFFSGALALLNQYVVAAGLQDKPGLGNVNPRLYDLAESASGVFHDIVTGDNMVPCEVGTTDCTTGWYGYRAGVGYDHVAGLGSIDTARLIEQWSPGTSGAKGSLPPYHLPPEADWLRRFSRSRLSKRP